MPDTPASLLRRLGEPNPQEAWERFVKLYTPVLRAMARRLGLQGEDCDDLIQEVFTILVRKLPEFQYRPDQRFRGFLWTVLLNKLREQRRRQVIGAGAGDSALDEVASPDTTNALDEAEYRACLMQRALELMQAEFQPATWKAFQECSAGRPAGEVAAELGLSVAAVYAAKSRILRRLREELDGLLD